MYSRNEVARIKQEFWTVFGRYMAPVSSAEGESINWINYKTGIKGINFRMDADHHTATVAIEISSKDPSERDKIYREFVQLKHLFINYIGDDWTWPPSTETSNQNLPAKISIQTTNVNILQKETWPDIISFLKTNLIALDACWSQVKYNFESL